tara:strand:+ start:353 stop:778 length:426 start_codon:yes stop_codon:yes gene_type:complete
MRIYFKNIHFPNSYIENKINEKFNKITEKKYIYIFSPDGIFRFNGDKLEKLYEKYNQNAKYDINSYKDLLIDDNINVYRDTYQIPLEHVLVDKTFTIYELCYNTKIVIEKENNRSIDLYLETGNEIDIIANEISSFLTLFT